MSSDPFALSAVAALAVVGAASATQSRAHASVTLDSGNMRHAEEIAAILRRHDVRATFFLANEKTPRGDSSLDPSWSAYWKARADEGHAFGSHTWRHGRFVADEAAGVRYRPQFGDDAGRTTTLMPAAVCEELRRVDKAFTTYAGRGLDALWRAPGGHTTPGALAAAKDCGFAHVGWANTTAKCSHVNIWLWCHARMRLAEIVARNLKAKRGNVTQDEFARRLGISRSMLAQLEDASSEITIDTLEKIANTLRCRVCDLLKATDVSGK